jgi:hypothetical protein
MPIENVQSNPAAADPQRMGGVAPKVNNAKRRRSAVDQDKRQKLHGRLMDWYLQERDKQAENRYQAAIDEDFYDGLQWSDEDAQELMARGQAPLVFNQIKPTINWMLGTERRTRIDGKVLPREEDDEQGAEVKSKLLKYLSDVNRTPFSRSQAFKSQVVAGLGWMEDAISTDPTEELLATRNVDWRQVYHDSNGKEMDINKDGRYVFRWQFLDLDVAQALIPDHEGALKSASLDDNAVGLDEDNVYYLGERVNNSTTGDYSSVSRRGMGGSGLNHGRERVKLIECWYKMPVACKVCRSDDPDTRHLTGEEWDPKNPEMAAAYADGLVSVVNHVRMEMRVAIMTENAILYEEKSPYKHNRFPFTPLWCYRRARDGMPYGVVRDIRDAQIDYNKRASKALYILSTVRVVMDADAYDGDIETLRAEVARPDSVIFKKRGADLKIERDVQLADQHLKLMIFDGQIIRDVGGVTDQNLGKDEAGLSGKAIGKLQDQGTIVTAALFDNLRLAIQMQTEIQLSLIEQYYTAPKVVRIIGENKPLEFLNINVYDEAAGRFINDITRSKADYIVSEQDFRASMRQAMFESMMELIGKLAPEVGMALLDMVIDFADVPNKEELVSRIRKINGQADPSRKPTPEEEAQAQASAAKDAELKQLNEDMLRAQLADMQAKTQATTATAQKTAAELDKLIADKIEIGVRAAYQALQAGQIVGQMPGTAAVADAILAGAGYVDKGGQDPNIPAPAAPLALPQEAGAPLPELQQADGAAAGIETATPADNFI